MTVTWTRKEQRLLITINGSLDFKQKADLLDVYYQQNGDLAGLEVYVDISLAQVTSSGLGVLGLLQKKFSAAGLLVTLLIGRLPTLQNDDIASRPIGTVLLDQKSFLNFFHGMGFVVKLSMPNTLLAELEGSDFDQNEAGRGGLSEGKPEGGRAIAVLVVDDEPGILEIIEEDLKERSLVVFTAESGMAALKILHEETVDVLVTDMRMPGMDGLELIQRTNAMGKGVKSIIVTGHGDMHNAIEALHLGVSGYLLKPPVLAELNDRILSAAKSPPAANGI
ncbi:MAG: response regulator [Magnetococcales bacterium]|nr:response regulator [Magnetococcales bacterium]